MQIAHSLQNRPRRRAKPTTQARTTRIRCLRASRRRSGYIVVDDASGERDIPSKRADPRPAPVAVKFGMLASSGPPPTAQLRKCRRSIKPARSYDSSRCGCTKRSGRQFAGSPEVARIARFSYVNRASCYRCTAWRAEQKHAAWWAHARYPRQCPCRV